MKKILNIIYYFSWQFWKVAGDKFDILLSFIFHPLKSLLFKIPFLHNRFIKLYGSIENADKEIKKGYNYVSNNKEWGISAQYALAFYGGAISFYFWGVYYFLCHYFPVLLKMDEGKKAILWPICSFILAYIVVHHATFKKDVYKKHFKELDKIKGWKRFAYKVMTFVFVIGGFVFWGWAMDFGHH